MLLKQTEGGDEDKEKATGSPSTKKEPGVKVEKNVVKKEANVKTEKEHRDAQRAKEKMAESEMVRDLRNQLK